MTNLKSKLAASALVLAFAVAPAAANHHAGDTMNKAETMMKHDKMTMEEKKVKWDNMPAEERKMKLQNISVEDHMKWKKMSAEEQDMWLANLSDEEKVMFKTSMKKHKNMHHDGTMKSDATMKTGAHMGTHSMTAEQRMAAEKRILTSMSDKDKAMYMKMSPADRKTMMNKRLAADYMPADRMTTDKNTVGQVLQMNEPKNPTPGDDDVLMSRGQTPDVDRVKAMEAQESDGMIKNNAIVVPTVNNQAITTVTCPVGTTAQPNGTCLITGDYRY